MPGNSSVATHEFVSQDLLVLCLYTAGLEWKPIAKLSGETSIAQWPDTGETFMRSLTFCATLVNSCI